jgi:hypothetical protein
MEESILLSTKKILGIAPEYDAFDLDVIAHINSALATLEQLGIGPEFGYSVTDSDDTWDDFLGTMAEEPRFNMIQSYVYLHVKMLFDPPTLGFLIEAHNKQLNEMQFRLSVMRDDFVHVDEVVEEEV